MCLGHAEVLAGQVIIQILLDKFISSDSDIFGIYHLLEISDKISHIMSLECE